MTSPDPRAAVIRVLKLEDPSRARRALCLFCSTDLESVPLAGRTASDVECPSCGASHTLCPECLDASTLDGATCSTCDDAYG